MVYTTVNGLNVIHASIYNENHYTNTLQDSEKIIQLFARLNNS